MKQFIPLLIFLIIAALILPEQIIAQTNAQDRLPLSAAVCINKAKRLFQNQKVYEAIALLEEFTAHQSKANQKEIQKKGYNHYYIYFLLENYYLTLIQEEKNELFFQNAMTHYQHSLQLNPVFSTAWLNLAKCQYDTGLFIKAAESFEKGYDTAKIQKPIHLYYAALCYFQAKKSATALDVFNRLLKTHPDQIAPVWKETLVHILFSLEKYEAALPWLEKLTITTKDEPQKKWQEILLYQYISLKMDKKALDYAEFLTRTDMLYPKWWKALCHIHLEKNQYVQGLSALIIYGYLTPMTRKEILLAADLYLSLNIPVKAAYLYEKALTEKQQPLEVK